VAAINAILDLEQRLELAYFAKIMQQMYNILPGNRSCDQEFKMAADCLNLFVRHLLNLENFKNFGKFKTDTESIVGNYDILINNLT